LLNISGEKFRKLLDSLHRLRMTSKATGLEEVLFLAFAWGFYFYNSGTKWRIL